MGFPWRGTALLTLEAGLPWRERALRILEAGFLLREAEPLTLELALASAPRPLRILVVVFRRSERGLRRLKARTPRAKCGMSAVGTRCARPRKSDSSNEADRRSALPGKRLRLSCGVRSAECGVRSAECGVRSAECGVRSAECGVRARHFTFRISLRGHTLRTSLPFRVEASQAQTCHFSLAPGFSPVTGKVKGQAVSTASSRWRVGKRVADR